MEMQFYKPLLSILFLLFLQHPIFAQEAPGKKWSVSTPQMESMIADSLKAFEDAITNGRYGYIDGMVIIRHGKLVYQKNYKHDYARIYGEDAKKKSGLNAHDPGGPYNYYNSWWHPYYRHGELHSLQSVTKTITSIIIGIAIARKDFPDISTTVLSFFDTTQVKNIDDRKRRMTIRHLLTMTAGFEWNEGLSYNDPRNDCSQMEASFDWIQYAINKPMAFEPGQTFNYNSGASELLAYIFRRATGRDIEEYAAANLFSPLGIDNFFWKRIPTGLVDTEGGLYLSETDLAKIFYLFLKEGNWYGKRLISKEWVRASLTPSISLRQGVKYGYKWWLHGYDTDDSVYAWAGSGFGGQMPIVIPEYDIVAVFTGRNVVAGNPSLRITEAIRRLINAVSDKK